MATQRTYRSHAVLREDRTDGSILLRSGDAIGPVGENSGTWLRRWASERPDTVFLAERSGAGWRALRYGEACERVLALAAALLDRGLGPDSPILIVSGNGVDHGILSLAAHCVGIPTVPVAEQYSLIPGAQAQLRHILELTDPRMVYAEDGERFGAALALAEMGGRDIVVSRRPGPGHGRFGDLLRGGRADVAAAAAGVGPDSVVKILMTSGSTSAPKGVLTTHRMMCANQAQYDRALPFLADRPPRLVDWLPWNHVFGGSNNFNMVLARGGSLYIDDGKPVKGLIGRSVENNLLMNGTIAYNVPVGFALLRDEMRANAALRRRFFEDLDMIFYAGASLSGDVWDDLTAMAAQICDRPPLITTCWGLTETAPACIFQHEPAREPGIVGIPLAGVTAKLVPRDGAGFEVRVKGPNVTPGYFRDPARTAAAFDDEGFFISGDAMSLVDPGDASKGLRFEGRLSEDFKLATGIRVRAAALRLELLAALAPLAADVIVAGAGRAELGLLIVPAADLVAEGTLTASGGAYVSAALQAEIARRLADRAARAAGSSSRVGRALILSEPPSMAAGEITAKGNLNFNRVLDRRADMLERLYADDDPAVIRI